MLGFPFLLGAIVAVLTFLLVPRPTDDPDIWWHLRNAQSQWHTHSFLQADSYAWTTAGMPWINHEWLAEVPFYLAFKAYGRQGLFLVSGAAIVSIFAGVYRLALHRSGNALAAALTTLVGAVLATISFGPRTLLFGWLALVVELHLLNRVAEQRPGSEKLAAWAVPLLFFIWVNTHGSWLIGLVLLLGFVASGWHRFEIGLLECRGWTDRQKRALVTATVGAVAALFANPYGARLVLYPFDLAFRQKLNTSNVQEWASLDFHAVRGHLLLLALVVLFVAQVCRGRRWAPYELLYLAVGVYSAFTYSRFLFLGAILITPLLAAELPWLSERPAPSPKPLLNLACLACLLALVIQHVQPRPADWASERADFPITADPYLAHFEPKGRVLNEFLWGGYLEWQHRQIPTFIDSRVDIFERRGVLLDYIHAVHLENTLAILDKYQIRYVLFHADTPLVYLLLHTPGWKVDYRDATTILLERATPGGAAGT